MKPIELDRLEQEISDLIGSEPTRYAEIGNDAAFEIPADRLTAIVQMLASVFNCRHLSAITAQQREGQADEIEVFYHFWQGTGFSFLMRLPADGPQLPSIISTLPGADFYEREAAEMFGINFTGRDKTPPLLLPDDWAQGPPLRLKEAQDE